MQYQDSQMSSLTQDSGLVKYRKIILLVIHFTIVFGITLSQLFGWRQHVKGDGDRVSSPEDNLVNCSWYAQNTCCRRTEVTSVFDGMYPLLGATQACVNHINYLMCYFCSPQQYKWYDRKANVCSDFCSSIYHHCHLARYSGKAIGQMYSNGSDFCKGQQFTVVDSGSSNCFAFDPLVFGGTRPFKNSNPSLIFMLGITFLFYICEIEFYRDD